MLKDGAWHDAQYNPRQSVPDAAEWISGWAQRSALTRQALPGLLNLPYGCAPTETADVFPAGRAKAPVLVFLHGGYWRALDKSDHSFIAEPYVAAGACVVVPNYALCPAVRIADIVAQMVAALAWVWRNAESWGGDRSRIVVAGHSAGGHLAAMLRCCEWSRWAADLPDDLIQHALSVSGLHDLAPLMQSPFLQPTIQLDPLQVARLSPAGLPPRGSGSISCLVGGLESAEFQRQNRLLRKSWGRRRVPVCEVIDGTHHFSVLNALADPASPAFGHLARALELK